MDRSIPYITLSEVVSEYLLASMNDPRKYFINYMVHAKHIYKKLYLTSNFEVENRWVKVDKSTNPYSIVIPKSMYRFINLSSVAEDGSIRSFVFDDTINHVPFPTGKECATCNETDDYGSCVNDSVPTTKIFIILGQQYTEKTWRHVCKNGDIEEVKSVPYLDQDGEGVQSVKFIDQKKIIANVSVKPCGCVKKLEENKACIDRVCGGLISSRQASMYQPTISKVGTRNGYMKIAAGRIWLSGNVPDWMLLSMQTNGMCGEDNILVHEDMLDAMIFGIHWRSLALSKGGREAKSARRDYDIATEELDMFRNPIRVEEFMNVQMSIPLWGSAIDQSNLVGNNFWESCPAPACIPGHSGYSMDEVQNLINQAIANISVVNNYYYENVGGSGAGLTITIEAPTTVWVLNHGLGYQPNVTTVNTDKEAIEGAVSYPSATQVRVEFNTAVNGEAYLS